MMIDSVNKVILLGDTEEHGPDLRYNGKGKAFARFTLVTQEWYTYNGENKLSKTFIPIVMYGRLAEDTGKNWQLGDRAYVEAKITKRKIGERYEIEIVADKVELIHVPC